MQRTVATFGLIAGAIMSAMMLLTMPFADAIPPDRAEIIGYTTIVAAFLLVFFGVKSYRDTVAGGTIGFGRALAVGSLIALVASLCYVATWELIYFKLAPDYSSKMLTYSVEKTKASGASPAAVARKRAEMESLLALYRNPATNAAITLIEPLPIGLVVALVTAGVLSRRRGQAAASRS